MQIAPIPEDEAKRIAELYKYELHDKAYEEEFNEIVRLASSICNVPMSLITLIDVDKQWFKARIGIDGNETARSVSFCAHAILSDELMEIQNALDDERFFDNPFVIDDPNIRYYAGMPLITNNGYKLGTLCVLDRVPRHLNEEQYGALKVLSKQVIKLFELRIHNKELDRVTAVQQKMMAIMAHDIRSPLASLESVFELKSMHLLSEEEVKEVEGMAAMQLNSTVQLLNNIVDWGKLQLSHSDMAETFNLHTLCNECFRYYIIAAAAKKNELENRVGSDFVINANRQGVEFMLRNILGNANKFTSGGKIAVSARRNRGFTEIVIEDTGVGMDERTVAQLQHKDWSVKTPGTQNEKGNGLGLQLIHEYLAHIKGALSFSSRPGSGTQVTICLPEVAA